MAKSKLSPLPEPSKRQTRGRVSQSDIPRHTLDEAIRIVLTLSDQFAKKPTKPYYVADAMKVSPTSSRFRTLTGAALAYGLTTGGYAAPEIGLTPLGRRIVAPTEEGDDLAAKREALLKPKVIREFLERYNDSPLPEDRIGRNVLEAEMGVAAEATERTLHFIIESARSVGLLKEATGKTYVDLQATVTGIAPQASSDPPAGDAEDESLTIEPPSGGTLNADDLVGTAHSATGLKTNRRRLWTS
jgi:hypothetical protein